MGGYPTCEHVRIHKEKARTFSKEDLMNHGKSFLRRTVLILFYLFILAVPLSCEDFDDGYYDDFSDDRDPLITDGKRDTGHPSVGLLNNSCSATLIGKRSVLTAAHCVKNGGSARFKVGGTTYRSSKVITSTRGDIALVVLQNSVSGIKPSPVNITKPKVGQRITLVGFGQTGENAGGFGTKRMGKNVISKVNSKMIFFRGSGNGQSSNCYGDSGGAAFSILKGQEVVVGVTSGGQKPCGTYAWDTRVDVFVDWLKQMASGDIVLPGGGNDDSDDDSNDDNDPNGSCEGRCSPSCQCGWTEIGCNSDRDCQTGLYCKMRPQLGNRCLKKKS